MLGNRVRSLSDPVDFRGLKPQDLTHPITIPIKESHRPPRNLARHFTSRDLFSYEQEVYMNIQLIVYSWYQFLSDPITSSLEVLKLWRTTQNWCCR